MNRIQTHILRLTLFALLLSALFSSNIVHAQSDIYDRFAGVYSAKNGPQAAQFVLSPQGNELLGSIVYAGRDYTLNTSLDGLVLKADFGGEGEVFHFRMPLSTRSQFQVTFEEDEFGAWTFVRSELPEFAGEFSTDFGKITLVQSSRGQFSGEYIESGSDASVQVRAVAKGLETTLQGSQSGRVLYSLEEKAYFVELNGQFSQANHKTPAVLEEERLVRMERDHNDWLRALSQQSASALEQYRQAWPKGIHVGEIAEVKEELFWRDVLASGRIEDYQQYSQRYPGGKYVKVSDDAAWSIVQHKNTDDAFDYYLQAFPSGRHHDEALASQENLVWRKTMSRSRIKDYKNYAQRYPDGPHIKSADNRAWAIAVHSGKDSAFDAYGAAFPEGIHAGDVTDAKAFIVAKRNNNMAGYKDYLAAHPGGLYATNAQAAIDRAFATIEAEKDDAAWRKALAQNTALAIKQYAMARPTGRHIDEVSQAIEQIEVAKRNRQDDAAFAEAQRGDSAAGYQRYLAKYHNGRYQQAARSAISDFQQAIDARIVFIRSVQSKLHTLGFGNHSSSGKLDNKTRQAILSFERNLKISEHGKANDALMQHLDGAIAFTAKLKKAKKGSAEHMTAAANDFMTGNGVVASPSKAIIWYKKAAQEGNPEAMAKLGTSYINGIGGAKNTKLGLKWVKKAIRFDNSEAMFQLGLMYLQGIEVRQSSKKGIGWLVKSVDKGRDESLVILGDLYAKGLYGISKNHKEALDWYQKAAAKNDPWAKQQLQALSM